MIQRELGLQEAQLQWIASSYSLSSVSIQSYFCPDTLSTFQSSRAVYCSPSAELQMCTEGRRLSHLGHFVWQYLLWLVHSLKVSKKNHRFRPVEVLIFFSISRCDDSRSVERHSRNRCCRNGSRRRQSMFYHFHSHIWSTLQSSSEFLLTHSNPLVLVLWHSPHSHLVQP